MSLSPCSSCNRHIKSTETSCPFCEASQSITSFAAPVAIARGASRAQRFAAVAAVAASASCVEATSVPIYGAPPPTNLENGTAQPVYGAPLPDQPIAAEDAGADAAPTDADVDDAGEGLQDSGVDTETNDSGAGN